VLPHLSPARWREDLAHLADGLRREHRNPFHAIDSPAFDDAVRTLDRRLPSLADHEAVVDLARLVARIGDGHTVLRLSDVPGFRRYPLTLYRFSDGLFVRTVAAEHGVLVGGRLLAIDGTAAEDAYAAVRPLVSRDNEMGVVAAAPTLLAIPEVLHACGVAREPEKALFEVLTPHGERVARSLQAIAALPSDLIDARDGASTPPPLWLSRSEEENWSEHLPADRALYVAHNRVRDGADEPLAAFFDRVFSLVRERGVERLILDIRRNHGGNNLLNRSLIHHLIRCDAVNRWGGLFAVIGRGTFSAAMNLAVDLERETRVLFVGEPTAASPNHYGETGTIVLPHSGLRISVSLLWWQTSLPYDDRPWIAPELPAALSSADYAANRDPAVEIALRYELDPAHAVDYPARLAVHLRRDGRDRRTSAVAEARRVEAPAR
jgi:hypothetical protein